VKGKERGPVRNWKTHIKPIVHVRVLEDRGRGYTLWIVKTQTHKMIM
jgi:hypothetical protein